MKTAITAALILLLLAACNNETRDANYSDFCRLYALSYTDDSQDWSQELADAAPAEFTRRVSAIQNIMWSFAAADQIRAYDLSGELLRYVDGLCGSSYYQEFYGSTAQERCAMGHPDCVPPTTTAPAPTTTSVCSEVSPFSDSGSEECRQRNLDAMSRETGIQIEQESCLEYFGHSSEYDECQRERDSALCAKFRAWQQESIRQGYSALEPELAIPTENTHRYCRR